jgi:hypothetical protein
MNEMSFSTWFGFFGFVSACCSSVCIRRRVYIHVGAEGLLILVSLGLNLDSCFIGR